MDTKKKRIIHFTVSVLTSGLWVPFWLIWEWSDKKKSSSLRNTNKENLKYQIEELTQSLGHQKSVLSILEKLKSESTTKNFQFKLPDCRLYETRQGNSVTESHGKVDTTTKTGTAAIGIGIGKVGLGLATSTGKTQGTVNTTSVTRVGKDQMTKIDAGTLVLTSEFIAFTGSQFSRTTNFTDLLSYQVQSNEILIAGRNIEKNWLVAVDHDSVAELIGALVNALTTSSDGALADTVRDSTKNIQDSIESTLNGISNLESKLEPEIN